MTKKNESAAKHTLPAQAEVAMSKYSFTPGPWSVAMLRTNAKWHEVRTRDGETIASVSTARDEVDANARLIAAAPDLLEALEHVERLLFHGENPGENGEGYAAHLDLVRAAIAKARGER